jgi:hypothetical protein
MIFLNFKKIESFFLLIINNMLLEELFVDDKLLLEGDLDTYDINRLILYRPDKTYSYCIGGGQTANLSCGRYELTDDTLTLYCTVDSPEEFDNNYIHKDAKNSDVLSKLETKYILKQEKKEHDGGSYCITTHYTILLLNHPEYGKLDITNLKEKYNLYLTQYNKYRNYTYDEIIINRHKCELNYILKYNYVDKTLLTNLDSDVILKYDEYKYSCSQINPIRNSTLLGVTDIYTYICIKTNINAIFYKDYIEIYNKDVLTKLDYNNIDQIKKILSEDNINNIDIMVGLKDFNKILQYHKEFPKLGYRN